VLSVWVTVLIVGVTLMVVLWAGTTFLQGYLYTEVSTDVFWQAPAAAAVLTVFYGLWCLMNYNAGESRPGDLPYDTIFRFSPTEHKSAKPPEKLWIIRKGTTEKLPYKRFTREHMGQTTYVYERERVGRNEPWPRDVIAILIPEDGEEVRYEPEPAGQGANQRFVSPDGWVIVEYESGPARAPEKSRFWMWLVNMFLNLFHLGLWFVCLWLLLRFQWGHALGLAVPMWLVMTIFVVPMMLVQTGDAAQESRRPQRQSASAEERGVVLTFPRAACAAGGTSRPPRGWSPARPGC
jgi:hypothetical protein